MIERQNINSGLTYLDFVASDSRMLAFYGRSLEGYVEPGAELPEEYGFRDLVAEMQHTYTINRAEVLAATSICLRGLHNRLTDVEAEEPHGQA